MPMNDPGSAGERPDSPATEDEARLGARLDTLGERLAAKRSDSDEIDRRANDAGNRWQGQAMRLATEFVAGVLVGSAIGWFFDGWLGTSPWGLIVFLLLGVAAGTLNALRGAGLVQESPARRQSTETDGDS